MKISKACTHRLAGCHDDKAGAVGEEAKVFVEGVVALGKHGGEVLHKVARPHTMRAGSRLRNLVGREGGWGR